MTRTKKIVIAAACAAVLLLAGGSALLWWVYGAPVPDSPALEAYGLTDNGMAWEGGPIEATKADVQYWLNYSCRGEQLAQSPRVRYLLGRPGRKLTLSPQDQLMMYIYDSSEESVAYTLENDAGRVVSSGYVPIAKGGPGFGAIPCGCSPEGDVYAAKPYDCGCGGDC